MIGRAALLFGLLSLCGACAEQGDGPVLSSGDRYVAAEALTADWVRLSAAAARVMCWLRATARKMRNCSSVMQDLSIESIETRIIIRWICR